MQAAIRKNVQNPSLTIWAFPFIQSHSAELLTGNLQYSQNFTAPGKVYDRIGLNAVAHSFDQRPKSELSLITN